MGANEIKTESDGVESLINLFFEALKKDIALLNIKKAELEKNKSKLNPHDLEQKTLEIEAIKISAQVNLYSYNCVRDCKTFTGLIYARKLMAESAQNFGKKHNVEAKKYNESADGLSTKEINDMSRKLYFDREKFFLLKNAILEVTNVLNLRVTRTNAPVVKILSPVEAELNPEIQKQLGVINSQVYAAKLSLKKIDPKNTLQYEAVARKVVDLEKTREGAVASLIGSLDEAHFMLGDVSRIEDSAVNALGIDRIPPYTLTASNFKKVLDQYNIILADLKFNQGKSKIFHVLHKEDNKLDNVTLSRDIVKYTNMRRDILASVLGENSPVLKAHMELVAGEGLYNIDGGYHAFKKQSGDIGDTGRSRALYVQGRDSVLENQMAIEEALRAEFEKRGSIEIVSTAPTYETEKEKRDLAYQKLISDIIRYRKGKSIRDARDAENEKERSAKVERIEKQMAESHIKPINNELGNPSIDYIEERLM